ncbi:disheveled-associated activator of morphogenesis 1-A-like isoform X1 [Haliotis rufescens]|uniref:disheveled-associated activator of morphogenesis 1-A-like isoform X1 n=1 Tax=Haliotis rufescens TaxID=6454 RepID=UPI00201F5EF4|nr:disheveled-associated activator of morphogenesis 1-A-like isoform X1 [Haliotis rufescens]
MIPVSPNTDGVADTKGSVMTMSTEQDRLMCLDAQWKIIFNEQIRAPIYAVGHYINYLRKYVHGDKAGSGAPPMVLREGISPMSYLLRKLKLDLKMSYDSFLYEFVSPNYDGLSLLFGLLRKLQNSSPGNQKSASVSSKHSSVEEYKRMVTDEHDCLLCIKFTLRLKHAQDQLLENFTNLETLVWSLLSSNTKSRITSLEVLTLGLAVPGGFDKVFDTFTYMRLKLGESVRFKLLISMLNNRGSGHVLFQVACMRFLNALLNCPSSGSLRVYLQEELRMAGFELAPLVENCNGDGLEFDDLRKELEDWQARYINVDTLLRKHRFDFRASRDRRYDRADGQVNYAVVHGQPQVNPRKDTRTDHLASKSVPNLSQVNGLLRDDVTITYTVNGVAQEVEHWAEERYNLSQIGHRLTSMAQQRGEEAKIYQDVPNMSYTFPDIRHYIMTYDITCLTGDAPDVLLRLLNINNHQDTDISTTNSHNPHHIGGFLNLSKKLQSISECEDRLKLIGFMNHYNTRLKELRTKISQVNRATESMLRNPKMKQLFEIILEFGTRMNGLNRESERGFKISSLESLSRSHVSSNDNTQTVLDYLVTEVSAHYPEVRDWYHELDADLPSTVSIRVMEKQLDYLKNGVKILNMEALQYPDVDTLKNFLAAAPDAHVQVGEDFAKMMSQYKEVCTMLGETDEMEPRDVFDMVTRFAADYRLTVEKMERLNRASTPRRPVSGGSVPRSQKGGASDFDEVRSDSTLTKKIDAQIASVSKRRGSSLNCFHDTSTDNVPPAIARRKRLSKNKSVPQKSSPSKGWFSFGRKSKSLSQPDLHREPLSSSTFEQKLHKDGSSSKTSLDGNWVLSPRPALPKDFRGQTAWKSEPELTHSPGHYLPDFVKTKAPRESNGVIPQTFMFPNKIPTVSNLSKELEDTKEGKGSPNQDYSETPTPVGTMRSYTAELAEILDDFEQTLYAHDEDTPRYMDGDTSNTMGPIVFV